MICPERDFIINTGIEWRRRSIGPIHTQSQLVVYALNWIPRLNLTLSVCNRTYIYLYNYIICVYIIEINTCIIMLVVLYNTCIVIHNNYIYDKIRLIHDTCCSM